MIFDLAECEEIACHSFRDKQLLRTAFTHTSYANEHHVESYERLEYFGDALLDFLVAEYLFRSFPDMAEGEMTTQRAKLVSKPGLKQIAVGLNLGKLVLLGEGSEKTGERQNDKILSSLVESLLAAVYLDGGMDAARRFVEKHVLPQSNKMLAKVSDYKTELQEYVQKRKLGAILYVEKGRSGPPHDPEFSVSVKIAGKEIATGKAKGKKQAAEQQAAKVALSVLTGGPYAYGAKPEKKGKKAPVLDLVQAYDAPPTPKKEKAVKKNKELQVATLPKQPPVKKPRAFRERPMPKNKPEKAKNFSAFTGEQENHTPKKQTKKEKPSKPAFSRKRKGGDGTPL